MADRKENQLPQRENALFKQIVKFYETKQYKKGLKASEQILKKFPQHGETLAMKGLTINCMGNDKKEEAYLLVKEGIKYDMRSHVCWHVYGLLYRSDRDYKQAIKCYGQALKLDKDNLQILRDLSLLQIQTRDLEGFLQTRFQLLQLKSQHRTNWVAYAVANHLKNKHGTACKVIEAYEKLDEDDPKYETSEMIMYTNMIMEEMGNYQGALEHLDANWEKIVDKLGATQKRAEFLVKLDRCDDAKLAYSGLLKMNPENLQYHTGLHLAHGLSAAEDPSPETEAQLRDLTVELTKQHPRAHAVQRVRLDFNTGENFLEAADEYVRKRLRSGIPSLYSDLLPLYKNPTKVAALEGLFENMLASLTADGKFQPSKAEPEPAEEGPMVIMWLWNVMANHYERTGKPVKAMELIDKAIEHTPSCVELYLCKGRIYKHHGNTKAAASCMEKARSMDLADRYLNTRSTVYLLRDGQIEEAEKTVVLFTKEGDQVNNLHEMQCMWWEIECGNAYLKQKKYGKALKKLTAIDKHFTDYGEDQFDFHSYCIRKMTLRTYLTMLRNQDTLRSNKNFMKAATSVIRAYLALHDCPEAAEEDEFAGMDEKEKKKAKAKKAKAEARAKEEEAKAAKQTKGKSKKGESAKKKDEDPDGAALLKKDPLQECVGYVNNLQKFLPEELQTHILAYDVFNRMGKPLAMLKALNHAASIDALAPEVHLRVCEFFHAVQNNTLALSPVAKEVVQGLANDEHLLGGKSVLEYNSVYCAAQSGNAPRRTAGAQAMVQIGAASKADVVPMLVDLNGDGVSLQGCVEVHQVLQTWDAKAAEEYKASCATLFPLSTYFNPVLLEHVDVFSPEKEAQNRPSEA